MYCFYWCEAFRHVSLLGVVVICAVSNAHSMVEFVCVFVCCVLSTMFRRACDTYFHYNLRLLLCLVIYLLSHCHLRWLSYFSSFRFASFHILPDSFINLFDWTQIGSDLKCYALELAKELKNKEYKVTQIIFIHKYSRKQIVIKEVGRNNYLYNIFGILNIIRKKRIHERDYLDCECRILCRA
jgi:hypothetical protein